MSEKKFAMIAIVIIMAFVLSTNAGIFSRCFAVASIVGIIFTACKKAIEPKKDSILELNSMLK